MLALGIFPTKIFLKRQLFNIHFKTLIISLELINISILLTATGIQNILNLGFI